VHPLVEIAGECWLGENLRASAFNNGGAIDAFEAGSTETASPCYVPIELWISQDDDEAFGSAYNQAAVFDARNVCPSGWQVSSHLDWDALAASFGGYWDVSISNENGTGFNVHPAGAVIPLTGSNPYGNEAIFAMNNGRYLWGFQHSSNMSMVFYDFVADDQNPNELGTAIGASKTDDSF
jgi:uncharacterized protein (TIGR02145 family)